MVLRAAERVVPSADSPSVLFTFECQICQIHNRIHTPLLLIDWSQNCREVNTPDSDFDRCHGGLIIGSCRTRK